MSDAGVCDEQIEQGLRHPGRRVKGGEDGTDVAAQRRRDADGRDLSRDRVDAHRGQDRNTEPVLNEFCEVLHVLYFADGSSGQPGGGAGDVDLSASAESAR